MFKLRQNRLHSSRRVHQKRTQSRPQRPVISQRHRLRGRRHKERQDADLRLGVKRHRDPYRPVLFAIKCQFDRSQIQNPMFVHKTRERHVLHQTGLARHPRHIRRLFVQHSANHNCIGWRRCAFLHRHRCHLPKCLELNKSGQKPDQQPKAPHRAHHGSSY